MGQWTLRGGVLRIAVAGYARLTMESVAPVFAAIHEALRPYPVVEGVTCLAPGVDQIFARAVLQRNGRYDVVLPARNVRDRMTAPADRAEFDALLARARRRRTLPYDHPCRPAYLAASRRMLARSRVLLAVWDCDDDERSYTSRVVAMARRRGMHVEVMWPAGAQRAVA
jgi:hypothetical protein